MITVQELVQREVFYCVSGLVSDLYKLVVNAPAAVLKDVGVYEDDLLRVMVQDDWETPVEYFIDNMPRGDVIEALENADVEDDRDPDEIERRKDEIKLLACGNIPSEDDDSEELKWPGIDQKTLQQKLFDRLKEEDGLQDFANNNRIDPETNEALEHWLVSGWLADKLEEHGEMVERDICGLVVWGRRTSGQAISIDYVIEKIHAELVAA